MDKEIHLRLPERLYDLLEKERIEKNLEDRQDLVREILEKSFKNKNSFFYRLKRLFN